MRVGSDWVALPGERFALGEGLRRVGDRTIMVDILSGRLLELPAALDAPPVTLLRLDHPLGAVAAVDTGWLAATGTGIARLCADGGELTWLGRPEHGRTPPMRMNDAALDPHGRFWAGSMSYDADPGAGSVYRLDPDGSLHRALAGFTVPNGPVFSADGAVMYLADSALGIVYRYPVEPATGELGEPAQFARVDSGSPDGMVVDAEGYLWSAIWGGGELRRYRSTGELDRIVEVPARQPTSLCFTDDHLIVTSATTGLTDPGEYDGAVLVAPRAA